MFCRCFAGEEDRPDVPIPIPIGVAPTNMGEKIDSHSHPYFFWNTWMLLVVCVSACRMVVMVQVLIHAPFCGASLCTRYIGKWYHDWCVQMCFVHAWMCWLKVRTVDNRLSLLAKTMYVPVCVFVDVVD